MSVFNKGRRTQRKHFKECRENIWKDDKPKGDSGWEPFTTKNAAFDEYYKEQGIVNPKEWDTFIEVLRNPLPATFRINSSSQFCEHIRRKLEDDIVKSIHKEGKEEEESIRPLPWYPGNLAWHSNFSRSQLRKNQTLERFHEFLKLENEIGNITRQEAVSMVPPLLLDVHPDHFVLDMCAAPGSKTFQLLEIMHHSVVPGSLPLGMVVANDLDMKRCNLLIHQTKRICTANLVVSNNEAQHFPSCRLSKNCSINIVPDVSHLQFDRVLCDVPCSGDGTLRKAPDIWRKWAPGMGNGLHSLQVQIALRGVALLKAGGRMVYSTCSMNPVEDEAVVAEVLRRCGDTIELVDVTNELPQLIRRHGLKKWKVLHKRCWYSSYSEVPKIQSSGILPSLFPRYDHDGHGNGFIHDISRCNEAGDMGTTSPSTNETSDFPLERCIRIMPHDQNSGAFFIAVFRKQSGPAVMEDSSDTNKCDLATDSPKKSSENKLLDMDSVDTDESNDNDKQGESGLEKNSQSEEVETVKAQNEENSSKPAGLKRKMNIQNRWRGVDPVLFFKDETVINSIRIYYGIDSVFPLHEQLVVRSSDMNRVKRIYYISQSVKSILELNFAVALQLKITSVGIKMFERQTSMEGTAASPCLFRISSEGLPLILPYITKQIILSPFLLFQQLLQYKSIRFEDLSDSDFGDKASKLMLGCCIVVLDRDEHIVKEGEGLKVSGREIVIGCWRGRASLSIMVAEADRLQLLERISEHD